MDIQINKNSVYIKSSNIKMVNYSDEELLIFDKKKDVYVGLEGAAKEILNKYDGEFTIEKILNDFNLINEDDISNIEDAIRILVEEEFIYKK